jgi:hypothetical protein
MTLDILISRICRVITAAIIAWALMVTLGHASCADQSEEINAKCWPTLQAAADAAVALDLPLVLPRGDYSGPLVIDYTQRAATGFELISHRATIHGKLLIRCQRDCFYFHQEGTLFVSGDEPDALLEIGNEDLSDPQNSIKLEHVIVNNGSSDQGATACRFNAVLNAEIHAVCDTAGGAGIRMEQVQFSLLQGAASASNGVGIIMENGYTFGTTIEAMDIEASRVCYRYTSAHASGNVALAPYLNCQTVLEASPIAVNSDRPPELDWVSGLFGGSARTTFQWAE